MNLINYFRFQPHKPTQILHMAALSNKKKEVNEGVNERYKEKGGQEKGKKQKTR
ncbi:MAG: hypothetical protein V8R91_12315 [Butyricimonas faecihominis]